MGRPKRPSFIGLMLLLPIIHCTSESADVHSVDAVEGCRRMMDKLTVRRPGFACGARVYCDVLGKLVAAGAVAFRASELSTCLSEAENLLHCTSPGFDPGSLHSHPFDMTLIYRLAPACSATFSGRRAEGEPCQSGLECGWAAACVPEDGRTVCRKRTGLSEPCTMSTPTECQDGLFCLGPTGLPGDIGTCVDAGFECTSEPAPACTNDEQAGLGAPCRLPHCEKTSKPFANCVAFNDCGGGLECNPEGRCALFPKFR